MKHILYLLILSGVIVSPVRASLFDRIKKATEDAVEKEVNEEINKRTRPVKRETPPPAEQPGQQTDTQSAAAGNAIRSEEDLYGRWEGVVSLPRGGFMDGVTLTIVITSDFASMRCSGAGSRCFSELTPTGTLGVYNAAILDQQAVWGNKASLTFADGGNVSVDWIDAPNTPADKRVYSGQLKKNAHPYPRNQWSSTQQHRNDFDIVGFTLGTTYEDAIALHESKHDDLEGAVNIVRDDGTVSIIYTLKEKGVQKRAGAFPGEQITLGFESQTPGEMDVEQDPKMLAKIEEREQLIKERNKAQQQLSRQRRDRTARSREAYTAAQEALPEIPPKPKLRPSGAEAELMFVSRQVQFPRNKGPHKDSIIKALSDKYGLPSMQIEPYPNRIKLAWIFDASNNRVTNAEGTSFDLMTKQPSPMAEKDKFYSISLTAARAKQVYNLVTFTPEFGLVVKAQVEADGNGAVHTISTTVYDAQRLLGDEWHRTVKLDQAFVANQKAKTKTIESRDIPDF